MAILRGAMADVEELLQAFVAKHERGGEADVQAYLAQAASEGERAQLASLMDAYLARAPRRDWDAPAFEQSGAAPLAESLARSLSGPAGLWPTLLPRLRTRARIARADLSGQLADRLGAGGNRDKVALYYHQMEQGQLPSEGVSDRVLEALGEIVGESREALRRAGEAMAGAPGPATGPGAVFARAAAPPAGGNEPTEAPASPAREQGAGKWDEIDRLFRGG